MKLHLGLFTRAQTPDYHKHEHVERQYFYGQRGGHDSDDRPTVFKCHKHDKQEAEGPKFQCHSPCQQMLKDNTFMANEVVR